MMGNKADVRERAESFSTAVTALVRAAAGRRGFMVEISSDPMTVAELGALTARLHLRPAACIPAWADLP
jgi:hypothetical protein